MKPPLSPSYALRPVTLDVVRDLCERFHGYGSVGNAATYAFAVYENDEPVAAYAWQPPPFGAARALAPSAPFGVLALSRMVAVPRSERHLNHVSKPLRRQMRSLVDRGRWPVLVTFSDEGQGHTGHVYRCSGWTPTIRTERPFYVDDAGRRASSYSNGKHGRRVLERGGTTTVQRWEHRVCPLGDELMWMTAHGWQRQALPGKVWASGRQAHAIVRVSDLVVET